MEAAAILGSKKWTPKWGPFSGQFLASQALAFWQWCNFALREASREPLVINLDESSIGFHWSGLFGTVSDREATDKVKSTTAKARATYICAVTHDPEVQQLLPQVLLGNTRCFTTAFVQQAAELFPHLVVWREKSAWNTQRLMAKYLRCLGDRLGPILETRQVYLLLDLAPCHLHDSLFDLAYTLGLRFLYIPPGMTSLLQPCDSHVFAAFEHDLQETWRQRKATALAGQVTLEIWLEIVAMAIAKLASKPWRHAFDSNGIFDRQQKASSALLRKLGWAHVPLVPSALLTGALDQFLFPVNWQGNAAKYIQWNPHAVRTLD